MDIKTIKAHAVRRPIAQHPYFAARTKRGKPYKRRQRIMRQLRARGLTSYLALEITTAREKKGGGS